MLLDTKLIDFPRTPCVLVARKSRRVMISESEADCTSVLFFVFTIMKVKSAIQGEGGSLVRFRNEVNHFSPLMVVFLRDGSLYFFLYVFL